MSEIEIKRLERRIAIIDAIGSAFSALAWLGLTLMFGMLALAGCPQPARVPPDASDAQALGDALPDGGPCALACANLSALGCVEGGPRCLDVCQHDQAQPVTVLPLACWASAPTKEAARACGSATSGHLECR